MLNPSRVMCSQDTSDEDLVRMVANHSDKTAFELLVKRHQARLRLYLRGLTGSDAAADDLAQETFFKVFRAIPKFEFQSSFKTWLMAVARNTFLDYVRLAGNRSQASNNGDAYLFYAQLSHADTASLDAPMLAIDLNKALTLLSAAEREVIVHCYFADLTMTETAFILGMPLGTVKTHSHRALAKLRSQMSAWDVARTK